MKCVNHPEHEATEQCVFCKDVLCDDCAYEIGNKVYACGKCYDKYILKKAQPVQAPITTEVENQSLCCWHCNKKLSPTEVYKTTEYGQCYCDQCYNKLFDPTATVSTSSTATSKKTSNKSVGTLFTAVVIISVIAIIIYVAYNSDYNKSIVEPQERLMTYSQLVSEADSLIESKERVKLTGYISDISSSFYHIDLYHGSQRFSALDIIDEIYKGAKVGDTVYISFSLDGMSKDDNINTFSFNESVIKVTKNDTAMMSAPASQGKEDSNYYSFGTYSNLCGELNYAHAVESPGIYDAKKVYCTGTVKEIFLETYDAGMILDTVYGDVYTYLYPDKNEDLFDLLINNTITIYGELDGTTITKSDNGYTIIPQIYLKYCEYNGKDYGFDRTSDLIAELLGEKLSSTFQTYLDENQISLTANEVQYNMKNNLDNEFYFSGTATLSDYYNYGFDDDIEDEYFVMSVIPSDGSSLNRWYIYCRRETFQQVFDDLLTNKTINAEIVAYIPKSYFEEGQGNMAFCRYIAWR